jgi:hypothetical protein
MSVRVFTVFHKALDERLVWSQFADDEIERLFAPYAVNAQVPGKQITGADGKPAGLAGAARRAVVEYELGWHDPALQARGFLEASCYVHVLRNRLYQSLDFVGVTQYDMRWPAPAAALLRSLAAGGTAHRGTIFGMDCGPLLDDQGEYQRLAFAAVFDWDFLLQSYNRFFRRAWATDALAGKPLTLFQTYILPQAEFVALASWLEVLCAEVYPWANLPPRPTHWGALSGYVERAEALFVALRLHEGRSELHSLPLEHDDAIPAHLGITKTHYG